jgi:hypothetical protein
VACAGRLLAARYDRLGRSASISQDVVAGIYVQARDRSIVVPVATVAGQIAEVITKAWNSAAAVPTRARTLKPVLHEQSDEQPIKATVDLDKLDLDQDA